LGGSYALYAYHLGLKVVHTEHSLFSLRTNTDLHLSWVITTIYKLYSKFICVSRAVRNNLILRTAIRSSSMVVIPNAVLSSRLQRIEQIRGKIRIVIVGRLVYRRGTDLLIKLLPTLCERNKGRFVMEIVGDGPKMKILRLVIERHNLGSMVVLHGSLPNEKAL
jgi:phosphatidylinositol N-acetylglucosaminyltransferase subunit A